MSQIQERSWLQRNIKPIIGVGILTYGFIIITVVLALLAIGRDISKNENVVILVINTVSGLIGIVVGYYFGSMDKDSNTNTTD